MASRADPAASGRAPASPEPRVPPSRLGLGGSIRVALSDAYFHSWRLLPANVVWAVTAIAVLTAALVTPFGLVFLPLLALPTAGVFRVTTRIVRGQAVSFWDAVDAWRVDVGPTLAMGAGIVAASFVLFANVVIGLNGTSVIGWGLATLAGWGLLALWLFVWTLWPILLDPARADRPPAARVRLAALLTLAHPLRIGLLAVVLGLFLAVSTVAIVALVTISVALAALVASRFVLPAADRLEAQLLAQPPEAETPPEIADIP